MKKCKKCGAPLEGFLYNTIGKLMGIKPSESDPEICNKCAETDESPSQEPAASATSVPAEPQVQEPEESQSEPEVTPVEKEPETQESGAESQESQKEESSY